MKINLSATLVMLLCFASVSVIAQGELGRLQKVINDYQALKSFSMDISAVAYKSVKDTKGKQIMKGTLKMKGNSYYSKMDDIEMIVNGTEMVVADHGAREIILGKSKPLDMLKKEQAVFNLDSLVAAGNKVSYVAKRNGNSVFALKIPNSALEEIELYINDENLMTKMVYYYASIPEMGSSYYKIEVLLTNLSLSPPADEYFADKKFIANKKSRTPAAAYRSYSVNVVDYSKKFDY